MDFKYGSSWVGWCSNDVHGSYVVGLWKNVRRGLGEFFSHTRFEVSDNAKIRFWHDVWCGKQALKVAFSELFNIVGFKDMIQWQIIWSFLVTLISGMFI